MKRKKETRVESKGGRNRGEGRQTREKKQKGRVGRGEQRRERKERGRREEGTE